MNKPFRLKDQITNLYYCPVRAIKVNGQYIKSNLSKKGKVYFSNPIKHITDFLDHTKLIEDKRNAYLGRKSHKASCRKDVENLTIEYIQIDE